MSVAIAFVPMTAGGSFSGSAIVDNFQKTWPDAPTPSEIDEQDDVTMFNVGDSKVIFAMMPAPIPWSDLEGPCATSVLWPNAAEELQAQESHVIVTVMSEGDPIDRSTLLTQATTSLLSTGIGVIGVYWGNATLVIPTELFCDFATDIMPGMPPIHIWVDFRVGPNEQGSTSGFTHGLEALGHMELETHNATDSPGELRERFEGLIMYLLENGPIIQDGNTIGEDANERIKVVYSNSEFGHESKVMRLDYESLGSKKPFWKFW